jgi:hypothetical protein
MITVATYRNLNQAEIGRIRLEEDGIKAFIADQANATAGYGSVTGDIRLQVPESDAERASAILSKAEPVDLPDDFDPGTECEHGTEAAGQGLASDRSIPEELRRFSRTVQNCSIAVILSMLLTCIYISFKFRATYRVYQESNQPSWSQVQASEERCEYDRAIRQAHALIARNPKDYYGHSYLTFLYMMVGDLPNAEQEARRAYELFPTEEQHQRLLAVERLQRQAATNTSQRTPETQPPGN